MKKSKCDLKKLALLGIAGGVMLTPEPLPAEINDYSQLLAFAGCGGKHGCGHGEGNNQGVGAGNSYQAYRSTPYYYSNSHCNSPSHCAGQSQGYYQSYPTSSSCQSYSAPQYYQQGAQNYQPAQPYYQQGTQSYQPAPQYYQQGAQSYQPTQPSQGCASYQSAQQPAQPSQGCSSYSTHNQSGWQQQAPISSQHSTQPAEQASSAWNKSSYSSWETGRLTADAVDTTETQRTTTATAQRALTENELLSQLNEQAKSTYQSLDATGKALALKLANQDCKGKNECKGLNSCKTADHACAGKGSCAGTAANNFKDKNLAVKVAALKMAEKRVKATSSKY